VNIYPFDFRQWGSERRDDLGASHDFGDGVGDDVEDDVEVGDDSCLWCFMATASELPDLPSSPPRPAASCRWTMITF